MFFTLSFYHKQETDTTSFSRLGLLLFLELFCYSPFAYACWFLIDTFDLSVSEAVVHDKVHVLKQVVKMQLTFEFGDCERPAENILHVRSPPFFPSSLRILVPGEAEFKRYLE